MADYYQLEWVVPADINLHKRTWGDETVIFHCLSGDVHLLNPIAAEVLNILQESPATCLALSTQIAARFSPEHNEELAEQILNLLFKLDELGLVRPLP